MTLIYARCRGYRRHGGGSLSGSSKWGEAKACAWCLCGCLHVVDDAAVSVCVCVRERGGCGLLHRSVCSCVKPAARGRISGVIWVMIGWEWIDRRWPQRRASTDEFEREVWLCVCVNECRRSRRHTPTEVHEGACWWPRESRQQPTLRCTHTYARTQQRTQGLKNTHRHAHSDKSFPASYFLHPSISRGKASPSSFFIPFFILLRRTSTKLQT